MYNFIDFFVLLLMAKQTYASETNYYWREYTGHIPEDAVVAGKSVKNENTYVGQAYRKGQGLLVAQIYLGGPEVYVTLGGVGMVDKNIKILCGPQEKFYWLLANTTNFRSKQTDKHAVIGGHEDKAGFYNIGRINFQGGVKIGKVNQFDIHNTPFYYNDKGTETFNASYEVLMYDTKSDS